MWLNTARVQIPPVELGLGPFALIISSTTAQPINFTVTMPSLGAFMELQNLLNSQIRRVENSATIYGVDLSELILRESASSGIPNVIEALVKALLPVIHTEGIFRLTGPKTDIEALQKLINTSQWKGIDLISVYGPHTVASVFTSIVTKFNAFQVLKLFFNELPQPLIPFMHYAKVLTIAESKEMSTSEKVTAMSKLIGSLPISHRSYPSPILEIL